MSAIAAATIDRQYRVDRAKSTVAAFLASITGSGSVALGFLVVPGTQHFGTTAAQFLIYFSILVISSAVFFMFLGAVIRRVGVRLVLTSAGFLASASVLGMAFAPTLFVVYVCAVPLGLGVAGSNILAANTLVTGWHTHNRRGLVLGLVACGLAVGGVAWGLIFPSIIAAGGYQGGAIAVALVFLLFSALPGLLLAKNPPPAAQDPTLRTPDAAQALKADRFAGYGIVLFILALGAFLISFENAFTALQPAVYAAVGMEARTAGYLLSFFALCGALAKPALGYMHDRFGLRSLFAVLVALFVLGLPLLGLTLQNGGVGMIFPALAIASLSLSVTSVILPLVAVQAVGKDRFPTAYGILLGGNFLGLAVATPVWGLVFDRTGSYVLAMYAGGAVGLVGLVVVFLGVRLAQRRRAGNPPRSATAEEAGERSVAGDVAAT